MDVTEQYKDLTEKIKNNLPKGWHLPTNEEWETLYKYLGSKEKKFLNL